MTLAEVPWSPPSDRTRVFPHAERYNLEEIKKDGEDVTQKTGKKLILCFDGTGNKFGLTNTNVIRFFGALKKDIPDKQLCYYQPGIGTYSHKKFHTKIHAAVDQKLEEGIARKLSYHIKEGYEFIMRTYQPGDEIFLFGFSRGAYIARALSGMICKVGLLPRHNYPQLDFAFTVYNTYDKEGAVLARKFKDTFAMNVPIQFIGVWDTVSSVGIIPTTLPFSTSNDGVKIFRHALALDERRARFKPSLWDAPQPTREVLENDPDINMRNKDTPRDVWNFEPIEGTNVKEVWFAGSHSDVGGENKSLSNVTLRWMILECLRSKTEIEFDEDELASLGFRFVQGQEGQRVIDPTESRHFWQGQDRGVLPSEPSLMARGFAFLKKRLNLRKRLNPWLNKDITDAAAKIYDQLKLVAGWWVLEYIPTQLQTRTRAGWKVIRENNRGRGRHLPEHDEILVHATVHFRMTGKWPGSDKAKVERVEQPAQNGKESPKGPRDGGSEERYIPAARNWGDVHEDGLVTWVY
ncbi:hypothetical protein BDN72DRAFT_841565 [Pluteus cervinus]|uniref:Uncharacterized protein n=1 Tax=Pluteus cervinus TaxID=181527 RepID=A0ACD3ASP6_9AGAR|nr:hypothetical protein BDN72DRAFT_841565 [Pluteus cervinus]